MKFREEIIKFKDKELIIKERNNRVLMYNTRFKRHIIQSKEVYSYIKKAEEMGLTVEEFVNMFEGSDKEYIKDLMINMGKAGILESSMSEDFYKNMNNRFKAIYLAATHKCNLACRHCCTNCNSTEKDILTTEDVKSIMDFVAELEPYEFIITNWRAYDKKRF